MSVVLRLNICMQQALYCDIDNYYEVFCGKGDTVELQRGPVCFTAMYQFIGRSDHIYC